MSAPSLADPPTTLYWDDLPIGTRFETSGRTITEADVVAFACLTADFNRLHVDAVFAGASTFGQRIAHGMLVASISIGLLTRTVHHARMERALLGLLESRFAFPGPTFFGDTVRVVAEVVERRQTKRPDRGVIVFRRSTFNQRDELVVDATATLLMTRRAADGPVDEAR